MGKASSQKKVARAASIGGGRTNRGKAPVLWYASLAVILAAGIGLTAFSRNERLDVLGSPASKEEPRANDSHWHVALGVRVCDRWLDPVQDQADPVGVHSHGDGIIHVHPFVASAAGSRATFNRFAETVKGQLEANRFAWPEGDGKKKEVHKNGDKCGDQVGEVKAFYNGKPHAGDPGDIRFTDRGKLVLAFVPKGTTYEQIGDPPSSAGLDKLSDVNPAAGSAPADPAAGGEPADPAAGGVPADPAAGGAPADPAARGAPPDPATVTPGTPAAPASTPSSAPG